MEGMYLKIYVYKLHITYSYYAGARGTKLKWLSLLIKLKKKAEYPLFNNLVHYYKTDALSNWQQNWVGCPFGDIPLLCCLVANLALYNLFSLKNVTTHNLVRLQYKGLYCFLTCFRNQGILYIKHFGNTPEPGWRHSILYSLELFIKQYNNSFLVCWGVLLICRACAFEI